MSAVVRVSPRPSSVPHLVLVALMLVAAIGVQVVRDRGWQPYEPPNPLLDRKSTRLNSSH